MNTNFIRKVGDSWIQDGYLVINVNDVFQYKTEFKKIKDNKLNAYAFYRFVRHEISEMLCDLADELPEDYWDEPGVLSEKSQEILLRMYKDLGEKITNEIWPEIENYKIDNQ